LSMLQQFSKRKSLIKIFLVSKICSFPHGIHKLTLSLSIDWWVLFWTSIWLPPSMLLLEHFPSSLLMLNSFTVFIVCYIVVRATNNHCRIERENLLIFWVSN
jgi:hypothetical protein